MVHHLFSQAIGIPEGPNCQLVEDSDLCEDIEIAEAFRLFLIAVRVEVRGFRKILPAGIFIPNIIAILSLVN